MNNKLLNNRIVKGMLLLQEYNFPIKYIKGKDDIVADILTNEDQGRTNSRELRLDVNI